MVFNSNGLRYPIQRLPQRRALKSRCRYFVPEYSIPVIATIPASCRGIPQKVRLAGIREWRSTVQARSKLVELRYAYAPRSKFSTREATLLQGRMQQIIEKRERGSGLKLQIWFKHGAGGPFSLPMRLAEVRPFHHQGTTSHSPSLKPDTRVLNSSTARQLTE